MLNRYRTLMMPAGEGGDGGGGGEGGSDPKVSAKAAETIAALDPKEYEKIVELLEKIKKLGEQSLFSKVNSDITALNRELQKARKNFSYTKEELEELGSTDFLEKIRDDLINTASGTVEIEAAFENLKKAITNANQELAEVPGKVAELQDEIKKIDDGKIGKVVDELGFDEFSKAVERGSSSVLSFQGIIGKSLGKTGPLRQAFDALNGLTDMTENYKAAMEQAGGGVSGFGTIARNTWTKATPLIAIFGTMQIYKFIKAVASLGIKLDDLSKKINASTGFMEDFRGALYKTSLDLTEAGVSMEDASGAFTGIAKSFSAFDPKNISNFVKMTEEAALLSKLGVGVESTAKAMDHFSRAMGASAGMTDADGNLIAGNVADLTRSIATMGQQIGITTEKAMSDFTSSLGRLSMFGKNSIKVFKELSAVVKATGLEMSTLTGIAQTYDKFDSAADSVAKLNAVLGTQLSTIKMMNATDSERIIMMREQVMLRVGTMDNFENMSKFEKMYVAQAMGLKDVAEAQRLLRMDTQKFDEYTQAMKNQAMTQEQLKQAMVDIVPVSEKFKLAMTKLMLSMKPFVKIGIVAANMMAKIMDFFVNMGPGGVFAAFLILFSPVIFAFASFSPILGGVVAALVVLVGIFGSMSDVLHETNSPANYLLPGVMGDGFRDMAEGVDGASGSLSGAIKSLEGFYGIMHKPGSPMLYALPENFAEGFVSIGESVAKATAQLNEFVSLMIKVAQLDFKGFIALRTDSSGTSMVMGSESVLTSISEGKLRVDVNMPEFTMPEVHVKVYIGKEELKGMINKEATLVAKKLKLGRT